MKKQSGFTMIELLVVMVILGALMTMGLSSYQQSMRRGRDAKRISDMQEVQKGFETYYAKVGSYADCGTMFGDSEIFPQSSPTPPAGGLLYTYVAVGGGACSTSSYCACAQVEIPEDYGNSHNTTCSGVGVATPSWYCVRNVQ